MTDGCLILCQSQFCSTPPLPLGPVAVLHKWHKAPSSYMHTQANCQPSPSALGACPKGCSFLYSIKPSKFVESQGHVLSDSLISGKPLSQGGPHTRSGTELTRYCGDRQETGQSWQSLPAAVELMQRQGWPSFADRGGGQLQGWLAYGSSVRSGHGRAPLQAGPQSTSRSWSLAGLFVQDGRVYSTSHTELRLPYSVQ